MKGSIRRRGKQTWELKFDLDRDQATGKRRTRYGSYKGTKRGAQDRLRELMAAAESAPYADARKLTVGQYLESWLTSHIKAEVSPKTFERYTEILRNHVVPNIGSIPLAKLAPRHIEVLRTQLLTEPRRTRSTKYQENQAPLPPLAPRTVKHVYRVLGGALRKAVKMQLITANPADAVDPPKVESVEIHTLSDEEARRVLRAAKSTRLYLPILVALTTGLRRGELLALRWDDIDFEKGLLSVRQSLEETAAGLRLKAPKTARGRRTITLPSTTIEALREHERGQKEERLKVGVRGEFDALVFSTRNPIDLAPCPLRPRSVTKEFGRICGRANVVGVTFHGLRHTHITNLLRANVHPKIASERAGHSSVAITLDVYSHAVPNMQTEAAILIEANIKGILTS